MPKNRPKHSVIGRSLKRRGCYTRKKYIARKNTVNGKLAEKEIMLNSSQAETNEFQVGQNYTDVEADIDLINPPNESDEVYLAYQALAAGNLSINYTVLDEIVLPNKSDSILKQQPTKEVQQLVRSGVVWECELHKIFISQDDSRYSRFTNESDCMKITVKMGDLENTLIPFHEPDIDGTSLKWNEKIGWLDKDSNMKVKYVDGQKYYRIGDYLSTRCIIRCLEESGLSPNCCFFFWCCCDYRRFLEKQRFAAAKISRRLSKQRKRRLISERNASCKRAKSNQNTYTEKICNASERKEKEKVKILKLAASEAVSFISHIQEAMNVVGPPKHKIRGDWLCWAVPDEKTQLNKTVPMRNYCQKQIEQMKDCDTKIDMEEVVFLHRLIIMSASQQCFDERLCQWYLSITQGRMSLKQWLVPFKKTSAFAYWKALALTTAKWSMQGLKSETILQIMVVVSCLYGGKVPKDYKKLIAFPQIKYKKQQSL